MSNPLFIDQDDIERAVAAIANPREHLIGEGKKFKTDDDALRGKIYSDLYVDKLTIEKNEIKAQAEAYKAELDKLRDDSKRTLDMINREVQPDSNNGNPQNKMIENKEDDIETRVRNTLKAERDLELRSRNIETVKAELQKTWGDDWQTKLEEAANEYGGREELVALAQVNPKAVLKLVGAPEQKHTEPQPRTNALFSPPTSSINVGARTQGDTPKGAKYFRELRKKDPRAYFSGEAFNERMEAMARLGDDYNKY